MDVRAVELVGPPVGDRDVALALAHRIAKEIELLKPRFPHLGDFSAETHVRPNTNREGGVPGTSANPELATISYFHGILGERPAPVAADGEALKRSSETLFDAKSGVRLYVHVFKGDSRGADLSPPHRVGDPSVHFSVDGPASKALQGELKRVMEKISGKEN